MTPVALTIAGSDPSGGAGIQADLKTFHQFGVYGEAVVTLATVQNTRGVSRVQVLDADLVAAQIRAVFEDILPAAVKTGALGSAEVVRAVASTAASAAMNAVLVVDPVMISKHGATLMDDDGRRALIEDLLPFALLVTPNLAEAEAMTGARVASIDEMREAAIKIAAMGPRAVLVKGGHLEDSATDVLYHNGEMHVFHAARIDTRHTHGTGCTYSAAITALLARGCGLTEAIAGAKAYVAEAIATAPGLGSGAGPVNHFANVKASRGRS